MKIAKRIRPFWEAFEAATGNVQSSRFYEAFHFDDSEAGANECARLVLAGKKCATASLLWSYEAHNKPCPKPGDLSVVTDWSGVPLCVIETQKVDVVPFRDVDEAFAALEGEGDGSLRHWREAHLRYFARECDRIGRRWDLGMPVLCETFGLVYAPARREAAQ